MDKTTKRESESQLAVEKRYSKPELIMLPGKDSESKTFFSNYEKTGKKKFAGEPTTGGPS